MRYQVLRDATGLCTSSLSLTLSHSLLPPRHCAAVPRHVLHQAPSSFSKIDSLTPESQRASHPPMLTRHPSLHITRAHRLLELVKLLAMPPRSSLPIAAQTLQPFLDRERHGIPGAYRAVRWQIAETRMGNSKRAVKQCRQILPICKAETVEPRSHQRCIVKRSPQSHAILPPS